MSLLNSKRCAGDRFLNNFCCRTQYLFLILLTSIAFTSNTFAAALSAGCQTINTNFGSGYTASGGNSNWLDNLSLTAGEVFTYQVTSTGSTNTGPNDGVGFAIYHGNGPYTIYLEQHASQGNELNLNSSFVVPETRNDYIVYAWGSTTSLSAQVTATVSCAADSGTPAPTISNVSPTSGSTAGGTSITITGANFTGATAVTFGGVAGTSLTVNSATSITVTTPAETAGAKNVVVTTPGGSVTSTGGYTYVAATESNSLYFDDNAKVTGFTGISPAAFTVEFRLFLDSETPPDNWQGIYWTDNGNDTGIFIEDDYTVSLWTTQSTAYTSVLKLNYGAWNHVAISYSAGTGVKIYVNGVLSNLTLQGGNPGAGILPLTNVTMGYGPGNFGLPAGGYALGDSALEDFRIWNLVRTEQEINDNRHDELASPYPSSLVRYYDFNHGIGGANNAGVTELVDRTGDGSSGTLSAFDLTGNTSNWVSTSSLSGPIATPTISNILPASGSTAGGTSITITGANFTGATAVTFGGVAGTGLTVNSATSITVTTPAGTAGVKDVVVTTLGGSVTSVGGYTYAVPAPTISSVSPSSGSTAGNTSITITGTNFTGATAVTFGGVAGTGLTVNSATSITVTTPAGTAGAKNVVVTTPGGSVTSTNGYTYAAPAPTISLVSPASGSTDGGTSITITGSNFTGATAVTFDGIAGTGLTVNSATSITVTTPAGTAGVKDVVVTTSGGSVTSAGGYTYTAASVVAPIFDEAPAITNISTSRLDLSASLDKAGRFYYVVLPDGATAPTATQVKAGTASTGSQASHSGSALISSSPFNHRFTISNLVPGTVYDIYVAAEDNASPANLMASSVRLDATMSTLNALYFDDGSETITGLTGVSPAEFTVEFKLYLDSATPAGNWPAIYRGGDVGIYLEGDNSVSLWLADGSHFESPAVLRSDAWNHVAMTYNVATGFKIYINGVLDYEESRDLSGMDILPLVDVTIGGGLVEAALDDFRIWNVVRTAQQINDSKNAELIPTYPASLVRYYDFNQGIGGADNTSFTALDDRTRNGASGTLNNFSLIGTESNWIESNSLLSTPFIASVAPASGNVVGGDTVVIIGEFLTGTTAVTFGGVAAISFSVDSETQITAIVPPNAAGVVDVSVTTAGGAVSSTGTFTYGDAPAAPTVETVTAGDGQVSVAFTEPLNNGGFAITGYTVTASPGGATATGAGSPITVSGLTNGTSYTFTVEATNSIGTSSPSAASSSVRPNAAPVISGSPATSVDQGVAYSYTFAAADGDVGDLLTLSAVTIPSWLSFNPATGALSGTPTNTDVGSHTVILRATDTDGLTVDQTFTITVDNVNDAPTITGTPTTSVDQDVPYSFTPTASDVDVGDTLTFSISNKPTWAAFNTTTGALTGTPTTAHVGVTTGIVITVNDGTLSASLPAFNLDVVQTIDPLQPVVTAPVDIDINATGLYTPVTLRQLLSLNPSASQEQIEAILAGLASDGITGNTCCTTHPEGLNANNVLLLPPGRHEVTWNATNAADISGTATQVVAINPLVSLSKPQVSVRGNDVSFRVLLNGKAPVYPLNIPYVIDAATTATSGEHNLVSGIASFTQQGQMEVVIPLSLADVSGFSDSQLVIALGDGINAGATTRHVIDIKNGNVPPVVQLAITQGGIHTNLITTTGGPVTVTASVFDANKADTHSFDWSATSGLADTDGNPVDGVRVFDPTGLSGTREVNIAVTDSAGASVSASIYFRVVASLPVLLPDTDSDGDGIDDALEGTGDSDDNGIPDYLDNMPSSNILPQQGKVTDAFLIECDPGVRCGLGLFARSGTSGGVQILDEDIAALNNIVVDPAFKPIGGIFDFVVRDLPTVGQSVRIVIPQREAIPANAVYRKFQKGSWVSFQEDGDNALHSAPGNLGYCPPPGSSEWQNGLVAGYLCVQLTIKDGGRNDDDGLENGAVVDPGAVSVALPVEPPEPEPPVVEPPQPPAPVKPPVEIKSKGGGAMGEFWLLLLGGLMMFKRVKPTWLTLVALVITSVNTQATPAEGTYVRVEGYSVESSLDGEKFNAALANSGHEFTLTKYDESRNGFQLSLGYQWANSTYSELGYLDLGEVEVDLILDGGADMAAFKRDFARYYPASASGITFVHGVSVELYSRVRLSLEGGVFVWQEQVDVNQANFGMEDEDGVDPLAGVRLEVDLSQSISVGLSSRRIYFDEDAVDMFSLSGRYRF